MKWYNYLFEFFQCFAIGWLLKDSGYVWKALSHQANINDIVSKEIENVSCHINQIRSLNSLLPNPRDKKEKL